MSVPEKKKEKSIIVLKTKLLKYIAEKLSKKQTKVAETFGLSKQTDTE